MQKKIKNKKLHPSCFSLSPKLLQLGAGAACGFTLEFCPDIKNKEGGKNLLDLQVYSDYKVHESLSLDFLLLQLAVLFWGGLCSVHVHVCGVTTQTDLETIQKQLTRAFERSVKHHRTSFMPSRL